MELTLPPDQITTAWGTVQEATAETEIAKLFRPNEIKVPSPDFTNFATQLAIYTELNKVAAPQLVNGRFEIGPIAADTLQLFPGLRGLALTKVRDQAGRINMIGGPAIVLPSGTELAILVAEDPNLISGSFTETQHALLKIEYCKALANETVPAEHSAQDVTNAGSIGPALVVVSSPRADLAHTDLHSLAADPTQTTGKTFGSKFAESERQDFVTDNGQTRFVRCVVVKARRAILRTGAHDQQPDTDSMLGGLGLTDNEMAVGMTHAATATRLTITPNVGATIIAMTKDSRFAV